MPKSRRLKMELRRTAKERSVSFTKRRQGLFSKAANFNVITDAQIALWITSPCATGKTYSFASHRFINRILDSFLQSSVLEPFNFAEKVSAISLWHEINSLESNASGVQRFPWALEEFENCNSVVVLREIVERLESMRNGLISRVNGGPIPVKTLLSHYDYENDESLWKNIDEFDFSAVLSEFAEKPTSNETEATD